MNKLITAMLFMVVCGFFSNPISTAEAAKHHSSSRHHHKHSHHHRHSGSAGHSDGKHGMASWYGPKFQGRRTANGEHYDMYAMTAAHRTLPLSSYVEVKNLKNNRSVIVRINDRGPYHGRRIMDLSYAAAKELGIQQSGTGAIVITPIAQN